MLHLFTLIFVVRSHYEHFDQWADFHGKSYGADEYHHRYKIWLDNLEFINKQNSIKPYKSDLNQFGDMTFHEFVSQLKHPHRPIKTTPFNHQLILPKSFDWRRFNVVTPVKNQMECGSCWAFSATGCIESFHAIKTGKLVELSEENLIDCSFDYGSDGCAGGLPVDAFEYVLKNGGINTEEAYPLESIYGWQCLAPEMCPCKFNRSAVGAKISGYNHYQNHNETILEATIIKFGPVSAGIDATRDLQFYKSGIFSDATCSSSELNHAILVVGYGEDLTGNKYFIVKNSWSTDWGEAGYVRMARGKNNMCGIASDYAVVY